MVTTSSGTEITWGADSYGRAGKRTLSTPQARTVYKSKTRQNKKKLEALTNPPTDAPPPPETSNMSDSPTFEDEIITCCHFGKNRRSLYPGFFFCSPCTYWDNVSFDGSSKHQRNSTRNACTANHNSWVKPTDQRLETLAEYNERVAITNSKTVTGNVSGKRQRKKRKFFGDSDDDEDYVIINDDKTL